MNDRLKNQRIELKHIQLELKANRLNHLRHFIDQYYCYKHGYITRTGRANWKLLIKKDWISINAEKIMDRKLLVKEHVVPLKFIAEKLSELHPKYTLANIEKILDTYLHFATISKTENIRLNQAGVKQTMPADFFDPKNPHFNDLFARYKICGISYKKVL